MAALINSGILPWATSEHDGDVIDADGREVAQFFSADDQEYAIRAVNSFNELLAALKAVVGDGYCDGGPSCGQDYVRKSAIALVRAAIRKAESGE